MYLKKYHFQVAPELQEKLTAVELEALKKQVKEHLEHDFFRIKPIKTSLKIKCYEQKVHLAKQTYRVAFLVTAKEVELCYLSSSLIKRVFDKEVQKYLRKRQKR